MSHGGTPFHDFAGPFPDWWLLGNIDEVTQSSPFFVNLVAKIRKM
jgi:hypothetical protein